MWKIKRTKSKKKEMKEEFKKPIKKEAIEMANRQADELFDIPEFIKKDYQTMIKSGQKVCLANIKDDEFYKIHYLDHILIIDTHYTRIEERQTSDFVDYLGLMNSFKLLFGVAACVYAMKVNVYMAAMMTCVFTIQVAQEWARYYVNYNKVLGNELWKLKS